MPVGNAPPQLNPVKVSIAISRISCPAVATRVRVPPCQCGEQLKVSRDSHSAPAQCKSL